MFDELDHAAVLVTGATGFIGRRLVETLRSRSAVVHVLVRHGSRAPCNTWPAGAVIERHGDLDRPQTLDGVCAGVETVFHLAGYSGSEPDDAEENAHWQVTVDGTRALLVQAGMAGVRRFVFVSSVKAMGEDSVTQLDESSPATPVSHYGRAKLEAEKLVLDAGRKHGIHVCVLRLPLVYGRDNQGNIPRMVAAIDRGWFPPLPEVGNKRSMVHVDDVVQAILLAATNLSAAGKVYIVTDGQAYSTRQIYEWTCAVLQCPVPRWTLPLPLLRFAAHMGDIIGRVSGRHFVLDTDALDKLIGSAWYSSEKISRELNYRPVHTLRDSLPEIVAEFRKSQSQ